VGCVSGLRARTMTYELLDLLQTFGTLVHLDII